MDLKSKIFWAIASLTLIISAMLLEIGSANPIMAGYAETVEASAG